MRVFSQVFIFVAVLSASRASERQRLGDFYNELMETFDSVRDSDPYIAILRLVDQDCVKQNLNFEHNEKKELLIRDNVMAFMMSHEICLENKAPLWNLVTETLLEQVAPHFNEDTPDDLQFMEPPEQLTDDEIYCLKENLYKLEPTAAIIEGFVEENGANCNRNVYVYTLYLQLFVTKSGGQIYGFEDYPLRDVDALELKLQILRHMKDKDEKERQIGKLKEELERKTAEVHSKTIARINKM